jgi:hypothetical protein
MSKFLISYDLKGEEYKEDYNDVIEYIESFPKHAKALYSQWVVESDHTASEIRAELQNIVDGTDVVFVVKIDSSWASLNLPKDAVSVLKG